MAQAASEGAHSPRLGGRCGGGPKFILGKLGENMLIELENTCLLVFVNGKWDTVLYVTVHVNVILAA